MNPSAKRTDYMVLINEENRLPDGFEDTIELITAENVVGKKHEVEKKAYEAFLRLREDLLQNDGIQTELISTYRTTAQQQETFERYLSRFGIDYANKYVAKPGYSEHHTGFAIDVGIFTEGKLHSKIEELMSVDNLFKIVHKKLPSYGFILRYPAGKEAITGIGYEPWHFRYVDSPEIAKEITDNGLCFEEYRSTDTLTRK